MSKALRPTPQDTSAPQFPFLLKALITAIVNNKLGTEEKRQFTAVFQIDAKAAEMPWYALRNFLVPAFLKKELGPEGQGWKKIYEIRIEKMVNRHNPNEVDGIPLRVMTFEQLETYCSQWELPIRPREFHSVDYARQMISLFETDPKGYETQYAAYVAGKGRKYPELDGLRKTVDLSVSENLAAELDELEKMTPAQSSGTGAATPVNPADLPASEQALLNTPPAPPTAENPKVVIAPKPAVSRGTSAKPATKVPAPAPAPQVPATDALPPAPPVTDPAPATDPNAPADPFQGM